MHTKHGLVLQMASSHISIYFIRLFEIRVAVEVTFHAKNVDFKIRYLLRPNR